MKSRWFAPVVMGLVPLASPAMSPPPPGDFLKLFLARDIRAQGAQAALSRADHDYARELLVDTDSPYAEVTDSAPVQNEIGWEDARVAFSARYGATTERQALAIQQWDLGFTKSRPGREVPSVPAGFRDDFVGASAVKAGVEPDIFWKAIDLAPADRYTIAARYAVAAQILRERLRAVAVADHARQGLRTDVLERFLRASSSGDLTGYDILYLDRIVDGAMSRWDAGSLSVHGYRQLPTQFRVARIAAAYRDWRGSFASFPCLPDASTHPVQGGTGRPGDTRLLCFVNANDRAVYRWYVREHYRQLAERRPPDEEKSTASRLFDLLAGAMFLVGLPELELASVAEVAESRIAGRLLAEGAIDDEAAGLAGDRVLSLSCKAR